MVTSLRLRFRDTVRWTSSTEQAPAAYTACITSVSRSVRSDFFDALRMDTLHFVPHSKRECQVKGSLYLLGDRTRGQAKAPAPPNLVTAWRFLLAGGPLCTLFAAPLGFPGWPRGPSERLHRCRRSDWAGSGCCRRTGCRSARPWYRP